MSHRKVKCTNYVNGRVSITETYKDKDGNTKVRTVNKTCGVCGGTGWL